MPIWLRSFYLKEYREWKKAENENSQSADQGQEEAYQQYIKTRQNQSS